jgi:hypothetical protein
VQIRPKMNSFVLYVIVLIEVLLKSKIKYIAHSNSIITSNMHLSINRDKIRKIDTFHKIS